jgi:cytochrome c-type biogenesis protein CcmF
MYANLGFYLCLLGLILSIYGTGASFFSALYKHRRLYRSAKYAATASGLVIIIAAILLWVMLFQRDYSVTYIFENSSNDLPRMYTLTAFWSSLAGSHFLWAILLALFSVIAHWTYSKDNEHIMPYVSLFLQAVMIWMFYLLVSFSDPFEPMHPAPQNGRGMNALLQNPYMAIHPPALFIGYTALVVPFAYSMAALCFGDITEGWLKSVRRWTIVSWVFLTAGIFLGGRWAYVELGWAGYWAWDPVENSSFVPWLFATGLLHSLIVQDKIGHMKRLSILLSVFGFFFSFFGTFITRSGIIASVHSFAQSPVGPNYLIFLAIILFVAIVIYFVRAPLIIPANTEKVWGVSRESALIFTQFIIFIFALIIFIGTVYPIVSEAITGTRFNVQAPYFNTFAPWMGLLVIVFVAMGNLMRYASDKLVISKNEFIGTFVIGLIPTVLFAWKAGIFDSTGYRFAAQIVGSYLVFWSIICLFADAKVRLKQIKFNYALFFKRNLSYVGALVAHVGVLVAILGFLGNYRGVDTTVTLKEGDSGNLYGYEFEFNGIDVYQDENATMYSAPLKISKNGKEFGIVAPARSKYPTKDELLHEIGLKPSFWQDIYVVLADFDKVAGKSVTVQIYINPLVRIVWISAFIMVIGGMIAVFDPKRGDHSKDHLKEA